MSLLTSVHDKTSSMPSIALSTSKASIDQLSMHGQTQIGLYTLCLSHMSYSLCCESFGVAEFINLPMLILSSNFVFLFVREFEF